MLYKFFPIWVLYTIKNEGENKGKAKGYVKSLLNLDKLSIMSNAILI